MAQRPVHVGLAVVLALSGFLVTAGFIQEHRRERSSPQRRAELQMLIEERRAAIGRLSRQVEDLGRELERSQQAAGGGVDGLLDRVAALRHQAGLEAVRGPGVRVVLTDSAVEPRTREELTDLRIQDVDLQLVANALWRAGAEAVAVNGRRLVSTTAIRKAGSTILVNYRAVSSPYQVAAIGDPDRLRSAIETSQIAGRFDVWGDVYGLGFETQAVQTLTIPALPGLEGVGFARPVGGPG